MRFKKKQNNLIDARFIQIYNEYFHSIIDQIIKRNDEQSLIQNFTDMPKTLGEFKIMKRKMLKNIKMKFSPVFVKNQVEKRRLKSSIIMSILREKAISPHLAQLSESHAINEISNPLSVGTRVIVFNEDHVPSFLFGTIDAINYEDFNYRVNVNHSFFYYKSSQTNIKYTIACDFNIMPLESLDFIPISLDKSYIGFPSPLIGNHELRMDLDISRHHKHDHDQDRRYIIGLMVKASKLLVLKETFTSQLACLNLLSEREGMFHTSCCLSILVRYAQYIYALHQINSQLSFIINKLDQTGLSGRSTELFFPFSNCSNAAQNALHNNMKKINSTRVSEIIKLLLLYIYAFNTKSIFEQKQKNDGITAKLAEILSSFINNGCLNEIVDQLNRIIT